MARRKQVAGHIAAQPEAETAVAVIENPATPLVEALAQQTAMPEERQPGEDVIEERAEGKPSKLRTTVTHVLENGDKVHVVDYGNRSPLGIKFDLAEGKPSAAVLESVKAPLTYKTRLNAPMRWNGRDSEWQKPVDPNNPVASRLEAESRASDAVSRLKQEREQKGGFERF